MTELFWNIFKKSGNLDAFLAYKEFSKFGAKNDTTLENNFLNNREQNSKDTTII